MLKTSLIALLFIAAFALPQHARSTTVSATFEASLTITDACTIASDGSAAHVACRNASAWRIDGSTVTF